MVLCFTAAVVYGQADSAAYKKIQGQMEGCWAAGSWQFKYIQSGNRGFEYQSEVHASAPVFTLIYKDGGTYLEWIEMAGGEHLQKVLKISKRKLVLENEDGTTGVYTRNKDCGRPVTSKKKG